MMNYEKLGPPAVDVGGELLMLVKGEKGAEILIIDGVTIVENTPCLSGRIDEFE